MRQHHVPSDDQLLHFRDWNNDDMSSCDHRTRVLPAYLCSVSLGLSEIRLLVQVLKHVVQVHGPLGLHESIVTFIKLLFNSFLISIWSYSEHFSPNAVVLAVGETEDVVLA